MMVSDLAPRFLYIGNTPASDTATSLASNEKHSESSFLSKIIWSVYDKVFGSSKNPNNLPPENSIPTNDLNSPFFLIDKTVYTRPESPAGWIFFDQETLHVRQLESPPPSLPIRFVPHDCDKKEQTSNLTLRRNPAAHGFSASSADNYNGVFSSQETTSNTG